MTELKPCLCGSDNISVYEEKFFFFSNGAFIRCQKCNRIIKRKTLKKAVNVWNRRATITDNLANNSPILADDLDNNEIIKALECCIGDDEGRNCHLCPLYDLDDCTIVVCKLALDLIKMRQAEIKRLKSLVAHCNNTIQGYCQESLDFMVEEIEKAKSEAVKEVVERLKQKDLTEFVEEYYLNGDVRVND